jgi:hypothetical protein
MLALLLAFSSCVDAAQKQVRHQAIDKDFANDVFAEICSREIAFPEIVMSQAILETGWFRNHYLMSRNNLFAFKKIKYLDFITWQRSVEYYKEWQVKNLPPNEKDYYRFLIRIKYATDGYVDHVRKIHWKQSCPSKQDSSPENSGALNPNN